MSMVELIQHAPHVAAHIVVRGTAIPNTTRCGVYTLKHRELLLKSKPVTVSIANHVACFADVRMNEYLLGTGPAELVVLFGYYPYNAKADLSSGSGQKWLADFIQRGYDNTARFDGKELVMFLSPYGNATVEVWRRVYRFNVQNVDNSIRVVSPAKPSFPQTPENLALLDFSLEDFRNVVTVTAKERHALTGGRIGVDPRYPMLVTDANDLQTFYQATGSVYDDPEEAPLLPPPVNS